LVEGGHLGEARLEHAKQLGRAAYAILRTPDVCGMCDLEGEEKHLREFAPGSLVMDMMTPFPVERFEWVGGHRVFKKPGEGRAPYACLPSIDKNLAQHRSQRLVARLQDLKDRGITGVG
jgi:hypothetical protein